MLKANTIENQKFLPFSSSPRRVAMVLLIGAAFLLALAFCVPVFVLPFATTVPAKLWIFLVVSDLGLLAVFFRIRPIKKGLTIALIGVCFMAILASLATHIYATTSTSTTFHLGSGSTVSSVQLIENESNPMRTSAGNIFQSKRDETSQINQTAGHDVLKMVLTR